MNDALRPPSEQVATVCGGTGFLGRHVVSALARRGYRIIMASRLPNRSFYLPQGRVGQIYSVQANLRFPDSVAAAVAKADHVINLVGILKEGGRQSFEAVHAQAPQVI